MAHVTFFLLLSERELDVVLRNAVTNTYARWPRGEIPYAVSRGFSRRERRVIRRAAEEFSRRGSCVRWRPRDWRRDQEYVHILRDQGRKELVTNKQKFYEAV